MKTKKGMTFAEMTFAEKSVLITTCIVIVTLLLRIWDPGFLQWFHMNPMQEAPFLLNIIQLFWLVFQLAIYIVCGVSILWLALFTGFSIILIAIEAILVTCDIVFAIWNLITWWWPSKRIDISVTNSFNYYFNDIIEDKLGNINIFMMTAWLVPVVLVTLPIAVILISTI